MNRTCDNCGGRIRYDIKSGKLKCDSCSSSFYIKEIQSNEETETEMDCDIYTCSTCGADLVINNTESSTFCPFCGNATVVMSRVQKLKRPEVIIPFEITAEEAAERIKRTFNKGMFIPDVVHPKPEDLRGIYIPYHVTNVEFDGSMWFDMKNHGKGYNGYPYIRSGFCSARWVTTDASKRLNDTFSQKLEPYFFDSFKTFDENYLLGFYSDIADVNEDDAIALARTRVMNMAHEKFVNSLPDVRFNPDAYNTDRRFITEVYDKPVTAMLPAWFYTYTFEGVPYTIAVNGQTGQVSGGVPWEKKKFITYTAILSVIIGTLLFLPVAFIDFDYIGRIMLALAPQIVLILVMFGLVIYRFGGYKTFTNAIKLKNIASANSLTNFVNRRQGD